MVHRCDSVSFFCSWQPLGVEWPVPLGALRSIFSPTAQVGADQVILFLLGFVCPFDRVLKVRF